MGLLALACGLAATLNVFAGEPTLTLAMARTEHRSERRLHIQREIPAGTSTVVVRGTNTFSTGDFQGAPSKPSAALSLRPARTASLYPFALVRTTDSTRPQRRWASTSIEPGFGDLDTEKPVRIYGRNGTGWEEPSCGYVKVHLKF